MNIQKSVSIIEAKGSDLEKARSYCVLQGVRPPNEVIRGFVELQNHDGGFPFGMVKDNLSTINETTVALWWMEELDLLASPAAEKAFSFLLATQKTEGCWDEDLRIGQYELPSWIQLEDPRTRVYLSAYATYWLGVGGYARSQAFRKAIHFLIRNQDETGKFYGYLHTTWIAVGVFLLAGERYARISDLGLQALGDRSLAGWSDSQIAWALDCLSRGGLPKDHPFIGRCLAELIQRQKSDGSWASEDGEAYTVTATIQVLKVFKRYGLLASSLER